MILETKELVKLAIDGINAKIEKKQESIRTGERLLLNRKNDISDKSPLSDQDIKDKIVILKQEIEEMRNYKDDIVWADECDDLQLI